MGEVGKPIVSHRPGEKLIHKTFLPRIVLWITPSPFVPGKKGRRLRENVFKKTPPEGILP